MTKKINPLVSLFRELKRRKVFEAGAFYAAGAWLVVEAAGVVVQTYKAPDWIMQVLVALAFAGFPVALILSWFFKFGPKGISRDESEQPGYQNALSADSPAVPGSIAVLPFRNMGAGSDNDYFADGLTEVLIAKLAGIHSLRVISRTTIMRYRETNKDLRQIGRELQVAHIIEGSVLLSDQSVQVVAQLIDPLTDHHRWAETYTRPVQDFIGLLNEIACIVSVEIGARISAAEKKRLDSAIPVDSRALRAYLKGRHFFSQRTQPGFQAALQYFSDAIKQEADHVPSLVGMGEVFLIQGIYGSLPAKECFPQAKRYFAEALRLDDEEYAALSGMAAIKMFFEWDFVSARSIFQASIAQNPSQIIGRIGLGDLLVVVGEQQAAMEQIHTALRLDPLDVGVSMNVGDFLFFGRRYEQAIEQWEKTLGIAEHFVPAYLRLAEAYAFRGESLAAKKHIRRAMELDSGNTQVLVSAVFVSAVTGDHGKANSQLEKLLALSAERYVAPWVFARAYAAMCDTENAYEWLDRSINDRHGAVIFLGVNPAFDNIRTQPGFSNFLDRIGIADGGGLAAKTTDL